MDKVKIGNNIKARRKALFKTVDDVCEKAGISRSTWYRYEKGEIENISTKTMSGIAKVLQTSAVELLGIEDDAPSSVPQPAEKPEESRSSLSERDIAAIAQKVVSMQAHSQQVFTHNVSFGETTDSTITTPDYDRAAIAAMNLLVEHSITETPINPLPIMLGLPHVRVMPFTHMASEAGMDREDLIPLFGANADAATFHCLGIDDVKYVVVYNMRLPFEIIWRGIARELGHVVLGHDGMTRPISVRNAEAVCFSHHLICPRPLIQIVRDSGIPLTMNILANTSGCSGECVDEMRTIPGVRVPAKLNRQVKELFQRGIEEYLKFHAVAPRKDTSPIIDFGTYMEGYEE